MMMRMSVGWLWRSVVALTLAVTVMGSTCTYVFPPCQGDSTVVIVLANDSTTQFVSPSLGVCPNGMAAQPHLFVDPAPVIAPGTEVTYSTCQIGGTDGDCKTFATDFAIGLCGWQNGPTADDLTAVFTRLAGQIGVQFSCGDTVTLRWTDAGSDGGTWTSEVQPATGNPEPTADFQEL